MTKQEKIRQGLLTEVKYITKAGDNLNKIAEAECITDQMLNYLHSEGMVIKVDRELPELKSLPSEASAEEKAAYLLGAINALRHIEDAGFVAVEPIIEQGAGSASGEHSPGNVKEGT